MKRKSKKRQEGPIKKHVASKETASDSALEKKAKPLYLSTLLAWDLHFIAQYIGERERTTIEILRQRKLTKKEVLADLKGVLDTAETAKEIALEIAARSPEQFVKLAEESLIVLGETTAPVVWYYDKISLRKSRYDRDWLYKCCLRGYKQANEHRHKLQELSAQIEAKDEIWDMLPGKMKVANQGQEPEPEKPTDGTTEERSSPMSKARMMKALKMDSYKKFDKWAKQHDLRQEGSRELFTILLNNLDKRTRGLIEKA